MFLPPQMYVIGCLLCPPAAGLGVIPPGAGVPKSAMFYKELALLKDLGNFTQSRKLHAMIVVG